AQDVAPAKGLLAPADSFSHRLPHGDYDWREYEVVRRGNQILAGFRTGFRIRKFYESARGRADEMCLYATGKNIVDRFTGTHRQGSNKNCLAAFGFSSAAIESGRNIVNPFFFLGTVGEDNLQCPLGGDAESFF